MDSNCFNLLRITGQKIKIDDFVGKVKTNKMMLFSSFSNEQKRVIKASNDCLIKDLYIFGENSLQLTFESSQVPPVDELNHLAEIYPELEFSLISNLI